MDAELPPVPPRPDLGRETAPPATWRHVEPGRMGVGTIVGAGFRLWAESWFRWGVIAFAFSGLTAILIAFVDPLTSTYGADYWFGERPFYTPDPNPLAVVISLVGGLFLGPWEALVLTRAALHSTVEEPLKTRATLGRTIRGVHSLLWIFVLLVLVVGVIGFLVGVFTTAADPSADDALGGILAIVLVGSLLWIVPRLATLSHVFVGADQRGTKAIGGAWRLSKGAWGTSAGTVLLAVLIGIAIAVIPSLITSQMFTGAQVEDAVPRAIVQSLTTALVTPLGTAIVTGLYLELRARKGMLDQQAMQANLARFD